MAEPLETQAVEGGQAWLIKPGEHAKEMGRRSGEVRRAKALQKRVEKSAPSEALETLRDSFDRSDLGPSAAALAQWVMAGALTGKIQLQGRDIPALLKTLVDIARLEEGQATSHTAVASLQLSAEDALAQIQKMQGKGTTSGNDAGQ